MNQLDKNHQIKVSVITVSYNSEECLNKCLDSLLAQTLKDVEFICIDNGYPGKCVSILKEYEQKDPRVRCFFFDGFYGRPSYPCAINYGFSCARGEYICILDGDDWLEENALEVLYNEAKSKKLDILGFDTKFEYEKPMHKERFQDYDRQISMKVFPDTVMTGKELFNFYKKHHEYRVNVFLYLYRNQFLKEIGASMVFKAGDMLFTFQVLPKAERAFHIDEKVHHYYLHDNSASAQDKLKEESLKKYQLSYIDLVNSFYRMDYKKDTDIYLYSEVQRIMSQVAFLYFKNLPFKCLEAMEAMCNYENVLFGEEFVYFKDVLVDKEMFFDKRAGLKELYFFAAGKRAKDMLEEFRSRGCEMPVAICDNDEGKHGEKFEGIPVISLEMALMNSSEANILITSDVHYHQILIQVLKRIPQENIWFFAN